MEKLIYAVVFLIQISSFLFAAPKCNTMAKVSKAKQEQVASSIEGFQGGEFFKSSIKLLGEYKECAAVDDDETMTLTYIFSDKSKLVHKWMTGEMSVITNNLSLTKPIEKKQAKKILAGVAKESYADCKLKWDKKCTIEQKDELSSQQCFCPNSNFSVSIDFNKKEKVVEISTAYAD